MIKKLPPGSFFGRTESRHRVGEIVLLESVYPPDPRIPTHEHAAAFFDLVVEGHCEEVVGGRSRVRARSSLAFHPAGERHSSCWGGPMSRCFHIEVPASLIDRARQHSSRLENPAVWPGGTPIWLATRLYDEFRRMDAASPLAIEGLTLELLAECLRETPIVRAGTPPRWMNSIRDLLQDRFSERLSLEAIADSVGIHPAHLTRIYRRLHGCTLGDQVRKLRIEFACRRLTTTDAPLVEIALAAGFADQSHFSRAFKREMGVSPAAFRKSARPRISASTEGSDRSRT
jgi:AraC family transcriptional regulator